MRKRAARVAEEVEQRDNVEPAVCGSIRSKPTRGLFELALAADPVTTSGLVPGDGNVDEALEEVPLGRLGGPPGRLELLVGREVLAPLDQLESSFVVRRPPFGHGRAR